MDRYFVLIGEKDRRGPFQSAEEAIALLKETSRQRGHTEEEAHHFFLEESAVEKEVTTDGKKDTFRIGWLARQESGIEIAP